MIRFNDWQIHGERVFLRVDANVPIRNGIIMSDFRLRSIQPTLDELLSKGATVLLATHIGRPNGYERDLNAQPIADWLIKQGYNATFIEYEPTGYLIPTHRHETGTVYVLDNLRFYPGEQGNDPLFADLLRTYADYYIMDAFGAAHKKSASTTMLADRYDSNHRSLGYLIDKEINGLKPLKNNRQNLLALMAGAKLKTKISLLNKLITHHPNLTVFVGPPLVFTLLKALGQPTGSSLIDDALIPLAQDLLANAHMHGSTLLMPLDYLSARGSLEGTLHTHDTDSFDHQDVGITIGPKTVAMLVEQINQASLVFSNASMGLESRPETLEPMKEILNSMCAASNNAYTVIAGGTTIEIAQKIGLLNCFSFCSTGGSAAMAYIADQPMHGLEPFDIDVMVTSNTIANKPSS